MIKQTITFEDFFGNSRTEDFWFHLSQSELTEMELANNGFGEYLQRIINANDGRAIMDEFKSIILRSFGVKSDDGRRFIKSPELSVEFSQTPAYDQLFMRLVTDAEFSSVFVNGLVPGDLAARAKAEADRIRKQPQDHQPKQAVQTVNLPQTVKYEEPENQSTQNVFQQPQTLPQEYQPNPAPYNQPMTEQQYQEQYVSRPPHEGAPTEGGVQGWTVQNG